MKPPIFITFLMACLSIAFLLDGCAALQNTENTESRKSIGEDHVVELYNGGELVRKWVSSGYVWAENQGYRFIDKETGKSVRVSGDVVVSVMKKKGEER